MHTRIYLEVEGRPGTFLPTVLSVLWIWTYCFCHRRHISDAAIVSGSECHMILFNKWPSVPKPIHISCIFNRTVVGFSQKFSPYLYMCLCIPVSGIQETPASSVWSQLCSPQAFFGHCSMESSFPVQLTSSNHTRPEPAPKYAPTQALAMPLYTNIRRFQTTFQWKI